MGQREHGVGRAGGRDLAVTSYTAQGVLRWRSTLPSAAGTLVGDWLAAAPRGDVLAVGHTVSSKGSPIQITLARFDPQGGLLWRVDPAAGSPPFAAWASPSSTHTPSRPPRVAAIFPSRSTA